MIVDLEKFQSIIIDWKNQKNNPQKLTINKKVITSSENVTLLGLEFDSKLNLDSYISKICNKSIAKLKALSRIGYLIGFRERKILIKR